MHTTDIQIMPQNNFELSDSLLNVISYITIPSFPLFMPRNTAVDICDIYSKAPEKSQIQLFCTLIFSGAIIMFERLLMKNNRMKIRQNLRYIQFVLYREQRSCCDEKDHLTAAVLAHACILRCQLHTVHR